MPEIEAKFLVQRPEQYARTLEVLAALGFKMGREQTDHLLDRYFDTSDWRLYRAGWTFRQRARGRREQRTLKAIAPARPGSAVFVREEIEDPQPRTGAPCQELDTRLRTLIDGATPRELFRVATARRHRVVDRGGREPLRLELALDQTEISDDHSHRLGFSELELEIVGGEPSSLAALAQRLAEEVGLLPARLSKFERGLQTAGLAVPEPSARSLPALGDPVLLLPYFHLADQRAALERELPRAWEGLDPEGVHSMRVAIRRSRAALALFQRLLPPTERRHANEDLKWLSRALGHARDADVESSALSRYVAESAVQERPLLEGYAQAVDERRRKARKALLEALESKRFRLLMQRLESWVSHEPAAPALRRWGNFRIREGAESLLDRTTRRVLKRGRKASRDASAEDLHQLRLAAKRLRYALEFFSPYYVDKLKRATRAIKGLQDTLGDYQDAQLAQRHTRSYLAKLPAASSERIALERFIGFNEARATNAYWQFKRAWRRFRKCASAAREPQRSS